jgi:hypothetical protein
VTSHLSCHLICVLLNRRTSAVSDSDGFPSSACSVCDLPRWSNVSGVVILSTDMDLWAVALVIPNSGSGPVNVSADRSLAKDRFVASYSLMSWHPHKSNSVVFCQEYRVCLHSQTS